jgi:hypothetical protein
MEVLMEQFIGLDVSQKLTHVCVVDQKGSVVWRGTCLSTPEEIAATVRAKALHAVALLSNFGPVVLMDFGPPPGPSTLRSPRLDRGTLRGLESQSGFIRAASQGA